MGRYLLLALVLNLLPYETALSEEVTVLSLFMDIPSKMLSLNSSDSGKTIASKDKLSRVRVKDIANGYMEVDTNGLDAFESPLYVAMFLRNKNTPLLVTATELGDSSDELFIYEKIAGKWLVRTSTYFPKIPDTYSDAMAAKIFDFRGAKLSDCATGTYRFKLPRLGRKIEVVTATHCFDLSKEIVLFELVFDGQVFKLLPPLS